MWKADKFDPDHLIALYKKAGAKYFMSMGVHHDNFDLWNSKYQPRGMPSHTGPKKDIVGMWKKAAVEQGLKFAVSEHLATSYNWFAVSHGSDKTGPFAGVPYDGTDPAYTDLYHELPEDYKISLTGIGGAMTDASPVVEATNTFIRIKDLVDNYQPDLLYTDGGIPSRNTARAWSRIIYNLNAKLHGGKVEAVYTSKRRGLRDRHLRLRHRARRGRWHLAESLADRHLHRRLALQARHQVQDAEDGDRHAVRHRQPQRQSDAEFPLAQ